MRQNANTLMWVEYWINHIDTSKEIVIYAEKLSNGKWKCEIDLPLIEKKITSVSTSQINAMKNASDRAAKLINKYMDDHPELQIKNMFKGKEWIFQEDRFGGVSCRLSQRARQSMDRTIERIASNSGDIVYKSIKRIEKATNTKNNIFIHAVDRKLLNDCEDNYEIAHKITEMFKQFYGVQIVGISWTFRDDYLIVVGYTFPED